MAIFGLFKKKPGDDLYNVFGFWPAWELPTDRELKDKKHLAALEERARALGQLPPAEETNAPKSRKRA